MKKSINLKAVIIALIIVVLGVFVIFLDAVILKNDNVVIINIASSVVATGVVLTLTECFLHYQRQYDVWDEWKLVRIYRTRAEKNIESDKKLETHNVKQLDGIAFGLRSFRSNRKNDVLSCMQRGMNVRLLVMNPESVFIQQREKEENAISGSISKSIYDLKKWAEDLNRESANGKITIKFYDTMTLDFYWRVDDDIYIGPYLFNIESQQTITYNFRQGGKGFDIYSKYFETLWEDEEFCELCELS